MTAQMPISGAAMASDTPVLSVQNLTVGVAYRF